MPAENNSIFAQFNGWLREAFDAALVAGDPVYITQSACTSLVLPTAVVAIGKAACSMVDGARAAGVTAPGILITNDENYRIIKDFSCFASSHPVPDARGLRAAEAVCALIKGLGVDDHLLLLISGGGSALLTAPAVGISLDQKIILNNALLTSGLDIHDINVIRRLFSTLKGGRLARLAAPAKITQFLLSDVPGNRPESIASGVAVSDPVPLGYAEDLVKRCSLDKFDFVAAHMAAIANDKSLEPVRPGDPILNRVSSNILASNEKCRDAAAESLAESIPNMQQLVAPKLAGESQKMAAQLALQIYNYKKCGNNNLFGIISGGETVVSIDANATGIGGRSQELALSFACQMRIAGDLAPTHWAILAGGTDGRDGPTDAAGGLLTSAQEFDLNAALNALERHDSYSFLSSINGIFKTGSTGTNFSDLVLIVCFDI